MKAQRLALIVACLALIVAGCGGGAGSDQAAGGDATAEAANGAEDTAASPHQPLPLGPTVKMSKAEIARLPPLKMPRPGGSPPHRLRIVDLRKGSGPGVPKHDWVTNKEEVYLRYGQATYPEARAGRMEGPFRTGRILLEDSVKGLAMGLTGMKVGGRRTMILPPRLTYPRWRSSWGYTPYVNIYVVDLLGMEPPPDRRVEYRNRPFGEGLKKKGS